jgi:hypothetical protein
MNSSEKWVQDIVAIVIAFILISIGLLFLIVQWVDVDLGHTIGHYLWPFFVIVPGVLLFWFALSLKGAESDGLAIFASIVTMTGLVLLFQTITGLWATWAYAWALIAPTSVGLGMTLYGRLKGRTKWMTEGWDVTKVGIGLFLGFGAFFELLINISGLNIGQWGIPLALIVLGVCIMWRALRR